MYAFYGRRMSSKCAFILIFIGYTYAFVMASLPLFGISSYQNSSVCLPLSINNNIDQVKLIFFINYKYFFIFGLFVIWFIIKYNCIYKYDCKLYNDKLYDSLSGYTASG